MSVSIYNTKNKWPRALRRQKVSGNTEGMVVRAPRAEIIFYLFREGGGPAPLTNSRGGGATGPVRDRGGSHRSLYGMLRAFATWYTKFCIGTLIFNIGNCPLL